MLGPTVMANITYKTKFNNMNKNHYKQLLLSKTLGYPVKTAQFYSKDFDKDKIYLDQIKKIINTILLLKE